MKIDIQLIPIPPPSESLLNRTVVVMDVLRATSVMVQAMSEGALEIIPLATVNGALETAHRFPRDSVLLGGERESEKIPGFDLGNSPREYVAERVKGKRLILTTTNGTRAFDLVSSGKKVLVGSFLNIQAIAQKCLELNNDLLLFPSGDGGYFSLEDTVCGGMLIDWVKRNEEKELRLTDAAQSAYLLYQRFESNLIESFKLSTHGRSLIQKGFREDLEFCARINVTPIIPIFHDGAIRLP